MNEELVFKKEQSEIFSEEYKKEQEFIKNIKDESKKINSEIEKIRYNIKNVQRAIVIKTREIGKHKVNIKVNNMKLKGVNSTLGKTHESIVTDKSTKGISNKNLLTDRQQA